MKEHQKFFSVRNPRTGRIERFVTVANRTTADHGATILAGNQKVLAARLSDAKFFWENDLRVAKGGMADWSDALENVTFHNKMGSQGDRIRRIAALAEEISPMTGADAAQSREAAELAKVDLSSEMVYEFPELQGLMGRYYSDAAGLPAEVAQACEDHYAPLGPSDAVPSGPVSQAVALADKIDTLTGFWAMDEKPTGSKDPYALRRAALGVIRILLSGNHRLHLDRFFDAQLVRHRIKLDAKDAQEQEVTALESMLDDIADHGLLGAAIRTVIDKLDGDVPFLSRLADEVPDASTDLLAFFHDRLKVHLREDGLRHDVIDACLAMDNSDDLTLLVNRANALSSFLKSDDGENLLQGFKRAANILTQAETQDGVAYEFGADPKFAETDEERALFDALTQAQDHINTALKAEDFAAAMTAMAALRAPIDAFFEAVQVNADSEVVRRNRLNMLSTIRTTCLSVADLTRIEG